MHNETNWENMEYSKHKTMAIILDSNRDEALSSLETISAVRKSLYRMIDGKISSSQPFTNQEIQMLSPDGMRISVSRLSDSYGHLFKKVEPLSAQQIETVSLEAVSLASKANSVIERGSALDKIAASARLFASDVATGLQISAAEVTATMTNLLPPKNPISLDQPKSKHRR